jgi:two-component system chemotaxis response regulator CheB
MRDIIVVGASAGGVKALQDLVAGLTADLRAAVLVVLHIHADSPGLMPEILAGAGPLPAEHPVDGQAVEPGRVYVAPPDRHLLLEGGRMRLTRGPKENRHRPAIDPLFRSAAAEYGPRAIGVILTGMLDDGAAGLWAVVECGGAALVQDPAEAPHPSMPRAALQAVPSARVLRVRDMGPELARLAAQEDGSMVRPVPEAVRVETRIAMEDQALQVGVVELGEPSLFACPECHGVLLRVKAAGGPLRFRCHTGHAYTAASLLAELTEAVEDALWNAVRTVQESALLLRHLARLAEDTAVAEAYEAKAKESEARAEQVRRAVMTRERVSVDPVDESPSV